MTRFRKEYIKIARKLTIADIQSGISEDELSMNNIVTDGRLSGESQFFLGVFSRQGLMNAIRLLDWIQSWPVTVLRI
jgi:hypothetical protein